jgi:aminoglycoside phosphotransferase (APT) family kinase protein
MNQNLEKPFGEAVAAFFPARHYFIQPVKTGLINHSVRITLEHGAEYFLQRINEKVFRQAGHVQKNYLLIYNHAVSNHSTLHVPEPLMFAPGKTLFADSLGGHWRAFDWVANSESFPIARTAAMAEEVASSFGRFTQMLSVNFDASKLYETIPHFHDLESRYAELEDAVAANQAGRLNSVTDILEQIRARSAYRKIFHQIIHSTRIPKRVIHHDAKISNILFDKNDGHVISVVDLDTVMPGYFFSDLGDMIRSMVPSVHENDEQASSLSIRPDFYKAIVAGYTSAMGSQFTKEENELLHCSGLLMTYMQAIRFLTDHINGDIYYSIKYSGQNLHRATNQLALLEKLEAYVKEEYQFEI